MEKNKVKFWVDTGMAISFLIVAVSGFVLWLILPRGSGKLGNSFIFLREQWLQIHNLSSVVLVILILVHLFLNWIWIKSMASCIFKNKNEKCDSRK